MRWIGAAACAVIVAVLLVVPAAAPSQAQGAASFTPTLSAFAMPDASKATPKQDVVDQLEFSVPAGWKEVFDPTGTMLLTYNVNDTLVAALRFTIGPAQVVAFDMQLEDYEPPSAQALMVHIRGKHFSDYRTRVSDIYPVKLGQLDGYGFLGFGPIFGDNRNFEFRAVDLDGGNILVAVIAASPNIGWTDARVFFDQVLDSMLIHTERLPTIQPILLTATALARQALTLVATLTPRYPTATITARPQLLNLP